MFKHYRAIPVFKNTSNEIINTVTTFYNNDTNIFYHINKLPFVLVNEIKQYISEEDLIFVNREKYISSHKLIRYLVPRIKFENYIRNIVYRDFDFVFQQSKH